MALGRLAGGLHRNAGVIAALGVALLAVTIGLTAAIAPPLRPADWAFVPRQVWPWWPGPPDQTLLVFVGALFALGVAAFLRRPRSGAAQALLAGSAGNAATVALWATIVPDELAWRSASWLAFVAAGFLSLVLWSSLVHLVFVFPTRDRWLAQPRWLAPLIYLLPPVALASGAAVIGALNPTALAWVDGWSRVHAAIVSLLLIVAIVGIGVRFGAVSPVRRRQVAGIAASVAIAALASLVLIDLPILIAGAPLAPREAIVALALPIPVFLALALWQDRGFRLDRLRRSQMALLHAREEERRRLRRDLHDGLGPTLAAIGLKVDTAASWVNRDPVTAEKLLGEIRRDLSAALVETRRLVRGLRPPALDELGLAEAIRQAADELSVGEGQPAIAVTAGDLPTLPAAVEVAAYRIVQESLTNVVRHARAEHVDVRVWMDGDSLRIDVSDDGVGFEVGSRPGVGTEAMRERVEALGGDCWIASAPEAGTRVRVMLPVSPA